MVLLEEVGGDVVATGVGSGLCAGCEELPHALAVFSENVPVVGLRVTGFAQPPEVLDGVFETDATHVDPFCGRRKLGRVLPEAFLGKMEAEVLAKHEEDMVVVERSRGDAWVVAAGEVEDEAAGWLEGAVDLLPEREKPGDVFILLGGVILLLRVKRVGRRGESEIDGVRGQTPEKLKSPPAIGGTKGGGVEWWLWEEVVNAAVSLLLLAGHCQ